MLRALPALLFSATCAFAQQAYEPVSGQQGKDAVWAPTPEALVHRMLDMARVGPGDFVFDLGSGDGRLVIAAAKRGAHAVGIEYNPDLVELSRRNAEKEGVAGKAAFVKADLFETDFSLATVVSVFLPPSVNLKLRPKLLALRAGTRVVANTFNMGDWAPDETVSMNEDQGCNESWCTAHLWIVPARVEGTHRLPVGELVLKQRYQAIAGTLRVDGATHAVAGRVQGESVSFTAGGHSYSGRMRGTTIELR